MNKANPIQFMGNETTLNIDHNYFDILGATQFSCLLLLVSLLLPLYNVYIYQIPQSIPINNTVDMKSNLHSQFITHSGNSLDFYTYLLNKFSFLNIHHFLIVFTLVNFAKYFNSFTSKSLLNDIAHTTLFLLFIFMFMLTLPVPVEGWEILAQYRLYILLFVLCNILYVIFGAIYDFLMFKYKFNNYIIINEFLNKIILGLFYLITIFLAVWGTNGTWFLTKDLIDRPLGIIISILGTLLGSGLWLILAKPPVQLRFLLINSIFRSLSECLAFNAICWLTYACWDYFITYNHHILVGATVFTVLHLVLSGIVIYLEILGAGYIYYSLAYISSFFCGVFSTNSLFEIYSNHSTSLVTIIIIILSALFVIILHPNIYRSNIRSEDITIRYIITRILLYYLLFINFVFTTGLLFNYIN